MRKGTTELTGIINWYKRFAKKVKNLIPGLCKKYSAAFGGERFFLGGCVKRPQAVFRRLAPPNYMKGLCKKPQSFLCSMAACAAKLYFEWTSFFMISRSEIIKNDVHSKLSFAAEGGKILFTQPQKMLFGGAGRQMPSRGHFTLP